MLYVCMYVYMYIFAFYMFRLMLLYVIDVGMHSRRDDVCILALQIM